MIDSKLINKKINEFEEATRCELVVSVQKRAENYMNLAFLYVLAFLFVFHCINALFLQLDLYFEILIGLAPLVLLFLVPRYSHYFVFKKLLIQSVEKAAKVNFYDENMTYTKYRNGILFFISLSERKFALLFDKGILEKVSKNFAQDLTQKISENLKSLPLNQAVSSSIDSIQAAILDQKLNFPISGNELSDQVREKN